MKKNLFAYLFFVFSLSASMLLGMQPNGQHTKKSNPQVAHLCDLPDEILLEILFFMLGDNRGKAILTIALVSKRMNECIVKKLYENFLPGLQDRYFIPYRWRRKAPRESLYLILRGINMIDKDGRGSKEFIPMIANKGYRDFEYLVPAYGLAKQETPIKAFLLHQMEELLDEMAEKLDNSQKQGKKDENLLDECLTKGTKITLLSSRYWRNAPTPPSISRKREKIDERIKKALDS